MADSTKPKSLDVRIQQDSKTASPNLNRAYQVLKTELGRTLLERLASYPTGISQYEVEKWREWNVNGKNEALHFLWAASVVGAVTYNGLSWRSTGYTEFLASK